MAAGSSWLDPRHLTKAPKKESPTKPPKVAKEHRKKPVEKEQSEGASFLYPTLSLVSCPAYFSHPEGKNIRVRKIGWARDYAFPAKCFKLTIQSSVCLRNTNQSDCSRSAQNIFGTEAPLSGWFWNFQNGPTKTLRAHSPSLEQFQNRSIVLPA